MKDLKFRNLTKDEIEVRVGGGKSLLLYKTARVDCNILDETVGCFNWCKRFYQVKNTMICEIGININYDDETKPQVFVFKADGGDDDYTMEKIKAECSDSMKRACFQWGIGRSLYTAPKIKIPDAYKDSQYFDVSEIEYNAKNEISKLVITTNFGNDIVYSYPKGAKVSQTSQKGQENTTTPPKASYTPNDISQEYTINVNKVKDFATNLPADNYKKFFNWLEEKYGTRIISELTSEQLKEIIRLYKL